MAASASSSRSVLGFAGAAGADAELPGAAVVPRAVNSRGAAFGSGFGAAGFDLPDDVPQTLRRYGNYYNTHMHQFRACKPKENLYM